MEALAAGELRGLARYTEALVRSLRARDGLEVVAVASRRPPGDLGVQIHTLRAGSEVAREQAELPRLLHRLGADVFVAPANRGVPLLSPCPTVLVLHDAVEWDASLVPARRGKSALRFAYANVSSLAGATAIATVSRQAADEIVARLRLERRRVHVVGEGPDEHFYSAEAVPPPRPYVLYVGGFDEKKDVPTVVRAFARLPPDVDLVLAGSTGHGDGGAIELARRLGVADRVRLTGFVPDEELPSLYASCACFLFAGAREGFGLPVAEAMAAGAPVVVAAAGGALEVAGGAAETFPRGDDEAAAAAVARVLGSAPHAEDLRQRGRARAAELSWDAAAARFDDLLRRVAGAPVRERLVTGVRALRGAPSWTHRRT